MTRVVCALFVALLVLTSAAPHGGKTIEIAAQGAGQTASLVSNLGVGHCADNFTADCGSSLDHDRAPTDCSLATCVLILPRFSAAAATIDINLIRLAPRLRDVVTDGRIRERLERPPRTV